MGERREWQAAAAGKMKEAMRVSDRVEQSQWKIEKKKKGRRKRKREERRDEKCTWTERVRRRTNVRK
jgi:hypothetical protein